ncbi:hypothetical protein [Micromonospora mirobrigensis]|nr:hypothetical protein [Micromonospora mirobrigensis]
MKQFTGAETLRLMPCGPGMLLPVGRSRDLLAGRRLRSSGWWRS